MKSYPCAGFVLPAIMTRCDRLPHRPNRADALVRVLCLANGNYNGLNHAMGAAIATPRRGRCFAHGPVFRFFTFARIGTGEPVRDTVSLSGTILLVCTKGGHNSWIKMSTISNLS